MPGRAVAPLGADRAVAVVGERLLQARAASSRVALADRGGRERRRGPGDEPLGREAPGAARARRPRRPARAPGRGSPRSPRRGRWVQKSGTCSPHRAHQVLGDRAPRGRPALLARALEHRVGEQQQARAAPHQLEGVLVRVDDVQRGEAVGERRRRATGARRRARSRPRPSTGWAADRRTPAAAGSSRARPRRAARTRGAARAARPARAGRAPTAPRRPRGRRRGTPSGSPVLDVERVQRPPRPGRAAPRRPRARSPGSPPRPPPGSTARRAAARELRGEQHPPRTLQTRGG